jgi:hypothetical protein
MEVDTTLRRSEIFLDRYRIRRKLRRSGLFADFSELTRL